MLKTQETVSKVARTILQERWLHSIEHGIAGELPSDASLWPFASHCEA